MRTFWNSRILSCLAVGFVLLSGCGEQTAEPRHSSRREVADESAVSSDAGNLLPPGPTEADYPELHHLLRVSDRIYSGGEPKTGSAFASLKALGIKTVVSVDGAAPGVELAEEQGLRYVHIPIGYDGVPEAAGLALARVMRETDGPIYIHCHHGRQRGPAAAAVASVVSGVATGEQALEVLKRAQTGRNYAGLWRDVAACQPVAPATVLPELVSVAKVSSLAAAMAQIDRASDNLKLMAEDAWQPLPRHPDLVATQEAVLLSEGLREAARLLAGEYDARFQEWLQESATTAAEFEAALPRQTPAAAQLWNSLQSQCVRCHQEYRDS